MNKYRNKARFFEDQIVEKEQEAEKWKSKYEADQEEHTRSQDALIHGFNAEISNLKSQIFHFKTQLYSAKSPTKSPGGSLKSPDVKMRLFPMSPLNSSVKELNSSLSISSPRDSRKHGVEEQMKGLQEELDKNCAMIKELEHALQIARATISDLEKKLEMKTEETADDLKQELEGTVNNKNTDDIKKENVKESGSESETLNEKYVGNEHFEQVEPEKDEIKQLQEKVRELEPLMKDYFSMSKKLTDSDRRAKDLDKKLEDKINQIIKYEDQINHLESTVEKLKKQVESSEEKIEKLEEHAEELKTLNCELKTVIDRTATELQAKETESKVLSPKLEKLQKSDDDQSMVVLKSELDAKSKEVEELKMKLVKLKTTCSVKENAFKEATEKCFEFEFNSNEKEIENEDLKRQIDEKNKKLTELDTQKNDRTHELQQTGEELALLALKVEQFKRLTEEQKANINDLESAVANKDLELIEQDKQLAEKEVEINKLRTEVQTLKYQEGNEKQALSKTNEIEAALHNEISELKKKFSEQETLHAEKVLEIQSAINEKQKNLDDAIETSENKLQGIQNDFESVSAKLKEKEELLVQKEKEINDTKVDLSEKMQCCITEKQNLDNKVESLEEQISRLEDDLTQKENELTAIHANYDELKTLVEDEAASEKLNNALVEIADLKASLYTHKTLHQKVKGELQEALLTVENTRGEVEQYKKQAVALKEVQKELAEKDTLLQEVQKEMGERDVDLNKVRKELEVNTDTSKNLSKELEERDVALKAVQKEFEEKNAELECAEKVLAEMREVLRRRDEQLEELRKDLKDMNTGSEKLTKSQHQNKEKITILEKTVEEKNSKLAELENELRLTALASQELKGSKEKMKFMERDLENKESEIKDLRSDKITDAAYIDGLKEKISDLQNNTEEAQKQAAKSEKLVTLLCSQLNEVSAVIGCEELPVDKVSGDIITEHVKGVCTSLKSYLHLEKKAESFSVELDHLKADKEVLKERLEQMTNENSDLKNKLTENKKSKDVENELRSQLTLKEVECETVNLELKVLKEELEKWKDQCESLKTELNDLRNNVLDNGEKSDTGCDNTNVEKLAEIQRLYKAEKLKNEELQKLLTDTSELNCFSPQTGVRKLRKEKIEIQNTLVESQYKIGTLEGKIADLELKLKNANNNTGNVIQSKDPLTERRLKNAMEKLQETEDRNRSLIREVTELQGEVSRLENELRYVLFHYIFVLLAKDGMA